MQLYPALLLLLFAALGCSGNSSSNSASSNVLGVYIERAPESAVAPKGDEVVFECEMNLKPDRLEWRFRHSSLLGASMDYRYLRPSAGYNVTSSNDDRTWKLRVYVSAETLGDYQCVAWYGPGALASTPARLTLVSIALDNSSGSGSKSGSSRSVVRWSVAPKNCILVRCGQVISNPPAIWSFYRNGEKLPQSEVLPGAAGALVLSSVAAKDSGNYSCAATNAITGVELRLPQIIDVRVDYTDRTPPYFLVQQPATQVSARPGETIVLECPGVGSPKPEAVWSSPNIVNIYNNRTKVLPYGLQIVDVHAEDQGSYVCRLDNGIVPVLVHMIKLSVLERPRILQGPAATLTNEGERLQLDCRATGHPAPEIYWLLNGEQAASDNETQIEPQRLIIRHVQKRHAGVVQCFARNVVGETSEGNMLRVNPLQISGEDYLPLGNVPMRPANEHGSGAGGPGGGNGRSKGKRKYMRVANMVPPSRPNVTRLADDAVMLRWNVPKNDGLAIQFFKVQYRMLGDSARKLPRENWQTTNENIPFGRQRDRERERDRERDRAHGKNFTSSVTGLRADRYYRFRIIAVYSNNDNKEGNTSLKFLLQRAGAKSNLPVPVLLDVEPYTESAVLLRWTLVQSSVHSIDGYYAYYRPVASAAEYLKATVDGGQARQYKIDQLEPNTAYEFKLQSYNAHAASEFSAIRQGRTQKMASALAATPTAKAIAPSTTTTAKQPQHSIYPIIAGAAGGGILLLIATVVACLCLRRRKHAQPEAENKPQLEHLQADFVSSAVLGVAPHHKSGDVRRLNGVLPRMHITPNPLAQEAAADKNRNVMELRFLPPHTQSAHSGSQELRQETEAAGPAQTVVASSSCETLEACEGISQLLEAPAVDAMPSKPLPPLPKKSKQQQQQQQQQQLNHNQAAAVAAAAMHQAGLHHAQLYHAPATPTACTPTMLHKRLQQQQQQQQQQPPPVPPHAAYYQQSSHSMGNASPLLDQQRRTLERSVRSLQQQHQAAYCLEDGLATVTPTRIPSLRRQRRASGSQHNSHSSLPQHNNNNNNNNNLPHHHHHAVGLVGIPIVPGSPRVQRSPMPARALIKRTRLGSHTDNISSGSLNSIEV